MKPAVVAMALAAALMVACTDAAYADTSGAAGDDAAWQALLAQGKAEGSLVGSMCPLYSDAIVRGFKADTGIDIVTVPGGQADRASKFRMELQSGHVATDFHMSGNSDIEFAKADHFADIAANLVMPGVADPANWDGGAIHYVDQTRKFMPVPGEYVSARPVVNTDFVPANSLKTWADLMKPEFDGKIAAYDPTIPGSGQSLTSYLVQIRGEDFVVALFSKQHVVISRDSQQLAEWAARGLYPIVLGMDATYIDQIQQQGVTSVVSVTPDDGPGSLVGGCGTLAIPKNAPHPHAAMVFANWYLSQHGQATMVAAVHYPTFRLDVPREDVRAYFLPQPGAKYTDQYTEDWYFGPARIARESLKAKLQPFVGN